MSDIFISLLENAEAGGSDERFVELDGNGDGLRVRSNRW